jgi:transcriptional regulator
MYLPAHFKEERVDVLHRLVRTHPLGLLITHDANGLAANSIPFLIDPQLTPHGTLRAHVARANPVWRDAAGSEVLVVFEGPQAYISPGWYPSKAEHGKVVPTWNYVMVQGRGTLRAIEDAGWLHALVSRLTTTHEANQARPWAVTDAPPTYVDTMLRAIVGIEIELTALVGKWKVTQNRSAADRAGTAAGLDGVPGDDAAGMAREVRAPGSL